jgi:hypothetical protein
MSGCGSTSSTTGSAVPVSGLEDLKAKVLAALHRLQKLPAVVRSFFRDPNLRYITT